MAVNPMDLANYVQQQGQLGQQQGEQSRLHGLYQQYMSGPDEQRQDVFNQMAAINPTAADNINKIWQGREDQRNKTRLNIAQGFNNLYTKSPQLAQNIYGTAMTRDAGKLGIQLDPYDEASTPALMQSWAAMYGDKPQQPEQFTLGPGSKRYDASGKVVAEVPFAEPAPKTQFITGADGQVYAASFGADGSPSASPVPGIIAHVPGSGRGGGGGGSGGGGGGSHGKAPSGYQWNGDALEPIPGGPADKSGSGASPGRALGAPTINRLTESSETLSSLEGLSGQFKDAYAGNGTGGQVENMLGRLGLEGGFTGATPGQAEWWQAYDRNKNVVRNKLFGAALTPSEQAEFDKADINPNMSPKTIKTNLALQQGLIRKGLQRQAKTWAAQGYNREAINVATDGLLGDDAPTQAAAGSRTVVRTGTHNGRKVVQYSDGTTDYAD